MMKKILYIVYCAITGEPYEDEKHMNSVDSLIEDDFYRDRLSQDEIKTLVDISLGLHMTFRQRHLFYLSFRKLDWTRRSSVSGRQLILFCNIRRTRFTEAVFALKKAKGRFSIIPLLEILFSICTLKPYEVG